MAAIKCLILGLADELAGWFVSFKSHRTANVFASYLYTHITHVWPGHLSTDCYAPNCVHLCAFLFAGAAAAAARSFLSIYASCLCAPTRPSPTATPHRTPQLVGAAAKPSRKPIQRAYSVNSPPTLIILLFIRLCDNIMRTRAQIRFYLCTHSRTVKTLSLFRHLVHLRLTLQPPPPPGDRTAHMIFKCTRDGEHVTSMFGVNIGR